MKNQISFFSVSLSFFLIDKSLFSHVCYSRYSFWRGGLDSSARVCIDEFQRRSVNGGGGVGLFDGGFGPGPTHILSLSFSHLLSVQPF